jgi:hypothetical protein
MEQLHKVRLEERRRAARIILEFPVYSQYVVQKIAIQKRKEELVDKIMDGMQ